MHDIHTWHACRKGRKKHTSIWLTVVFPRWADTQVVLEKLWQSLYTLLGTRDIFTCLPTVLMQSEDITLRKMMNHHGNNDNIWQQMGSAMGNLWEKAFCDQRWTHYKLASADIGADLTVHAGYESGYSQPNKDCFWSRVLGCSHLVSGFLRLKAL